MSRSGSVTSSLNFLLFLVEVSHLGCLLGGIATVLLTGLSPNLVFLACLLGWTLLSGTVSETKTRDVLVCLILPLCVPERTVFWLFPASCFGPEMTEFSLLDGCRWLLLGVLLTITDVHISTSCWLDASFLSLYFGVLETMHSWTWNVDLF